MRAAGASSNASRCPSTPTRCGTATCPTRGPGRCTATASTARTIRPAGTASTTTSCCSTRTPRRSPGTLRWTDAHYGYRIGSQREDLSFDRRDNASGMPKCVVVESAFTWGEDHRPSVPWTQTVFYELHVRGFTIQHPGVAPALRGTFAGLASPAVIDYLQRARRHDARAAARARLHRRPAAGRSEAAQLLGLQLDRLLRARAALSADGDPNEFKTMVKHLHEAGIEVVLDVVYNHTAEGNHLGPTFSFKGIDNAIVLPARRGPALLRRRHRDRQHARSAPSARAADGDRLVALLGRGDARRRLPLRPGAGARARGATATARDAAFFKAIAQDPVLSRVKLIAEPWDVGAGRLSARQLSARLVGVERQVSRHRAPLLARRSRACCPSWPRGWPARRTCSQHRAGGRARASTSSRVHDGFTLNDLVSYDHKHNEANHEDNRDGTDDNYSWNCGVEGPTDDPADRQRCASGRSATSSRRCCCRWACR